jgi:hypothetical protein
MSIERIVIAEVHLVALIAKLKLVSKFLPGKIQGYG